MATIIDQRWDSGNGSENLDSGSKALIFLVADATDENDAVQTVHTHEDCPTLMTLPLGRLIVRKGFEWDVDEAGIYAITVNYTDFEEQQSPDAIDFSFDTTGGTAHITQSIRTVANHKAPSAPLTAADFGGAIGVTDSGVEGCDVPTRSFKWQETHILPIELIQFTNYSAILEALTGTKNAAQFRGRAARACIFHGAQGGRRDEETGQVTYFFEAGKHVTGGTFGVFENVDKEAWDYLWFTYREKEDTEAKTTVKKAVSCHVEEVIPEGDWSMMGIGR